MDGSWWASALLVSGYLNVSVSRININASFARCGLSAPVQCWAQFAESAHKQCWVNDPECDVPGPEYSYLPPSSEQRCFICPHFNFLICEYLSHRAWEETSIPLCGQDLVGCQGRALAAVTTGFFYPCLFLTRQMVP